MKFILRSILVAAPVVSAAVLSPSLPLDLLSNVTQSSPSSVSTLTPSLLEAPGSNLALPTSDLPDRRFTVTMATRSSLLPVNSALINILYFMSIVAGQHFTHQLAPRRYSTPRYRDVSITSFAYTEARFLLWGVFSAVADMVKNVRFHDVMLSLYWDDELVGKIQIAVTRPLSLVGGAGNVTQDLANQLAQPKSGTSSGNTTLIEPVFGNKTDSDLESFNSSAFNDYNAQRATVIFESIAGGGVVNRNDVFLTFYTALIHVAHFSIEDQMQTFQSDPPSRKACLHMQDMRTVCQYGDVIFALLYVPKYMMEHSDFGYRETEFFVKLNGEPACLGTFEKKLLWVER
ncbi:hypothetical protein IMSHALPRED_009755 [Imshaugia aleurites]|uniref:Uncharacterized protein n=1 Tax=Imshaugia aleurites TaxID=172621 RepID=A0A8H3G4B3_9LECA|nr:hypothetical protein IMSHALPRED_009755 [Imshaugia aleurites]